jgi:hypothetical protein
LKHKCFDTSSNPVQLFFYFSFFFNSSPFFIFHIFVWTQDTRKLCRKLFKL